MKLRKPCEHGRYDTHYRDDPDDEFGGTLCPGGVFLPDDAETVEREVLAAALEKYDKWNEGRTSEPIGMMTTQILAEAARAWLARGDAMNYYVHDELRWWPVDRDLTDHLEVGGRVVNALIEENDPNPSINWPVWTQLAYEADLDALSQGSS